MRFFSASIVTVFAVADQGDRAAFLRLGRDVADDEAVRAAGEAAVGHQSHVGTEAGADDGRGRREHLRHPGPALGSFEADDDDVALFDLLLLERVKHVLFGIEDLGRAAEAESFFARDLGDRSLGSQIAAQNSEMASRLDRLFDRMNHVLARREAGQSWPDSRRASCRSRSGSRR